MIFQYLWLTAAIKCIADNNKLIMQSKNEDKKK